LADTATGVFADRDATLLSLDDAHLDDAMTSAHFAGTRVTRVSRPSPHPLHHRHPRSFFAVHRQRLHVFAGCFRYPARKGTF